MHTNQIAAPQSPALLLQWLNALNLNQLCSFTLPTWMTRWSSTIFCLARSRMSSSTLPLVTKLQGSGGAEQSETKAS